MANVTESAVWDAGVYQLETTDPVAGGPSGIDNTPHKNLANRTAYLKAHVDAIESGASVPAGLATTAVMAAADTATLNSAKSYADGLVVGLWDDRGSFDASVNTFPTTGGSGTAGAILKGDIWTISVAATSGPLNGIPIGSTVRAMVDTPAQTVGNWDVLGVGTGYVPAKVGGDAAQAFLASTAVPGTNTKQVATTEFIHAALTSLFGGSISINDIGTAGAAGFGVGICPALPAGFVPMAGYNQQNSDNYGNYQYTDGSIMVWVPAFFYKFGTGANGLALNLVSIKAESAYVDVATANADGYALHRAFYDGGVIQRGVFVDKYKCSNNGGIASSIKNGIPLSSNTVNNPWSVCTDNGQAPAEFYYGAIAAAKSRGNNFFSGSVFISKAMAMLSYAHAQASTSTTFCAWYHATNNFPKGCNNNALGDQNDAEFAAIGTGYSTASRTGSANMLAKTTHNGQNCGVVDVNGTMWEVALGLTSNGTNFYVLKTSAVMKNITAGNTLATDAWGANGIAALYDSLGATYGALTNTSTVKSLGSATQVFDAALTGNAWNATGAGIPLVAGVGGTNPFGNDGIWDYRPVDMCPIVAGGWYDAANAGVGALNLANVRGASSTNVGLRAALYL